MFSDNGKTSFFSTNGYTNILWCLEKGLFLNETRNKAIWLLFDLCKIKKEYSISNSPINSIVTCFLAWLNTTKLTKDDKKNLICEMLKNDKQVSMQIIMKLLYTPNTTASPFNPPRWIDYEHFIEKVSYHDAVDLYRYYSEIAVNNAETSEDWKNIIDKKAFLYFGDDFLKSSLDKVVEKTNDFDDLNKEVVADEMRHFIHLNRFYSNSSWAVKETTIALFENALNKIEYTNDAAKFLHFFKPYELYYLAEEGTTKHENYVEEQKYISDLINSVSFKFIEQKEDIDYLSHLVVEKSLKNSYFPSVSFAYLYINYKQKNNSLTYFEATKQLISLFPPETSFVSDLGLKIFEENRSIFFEIAQYLVRKEDFSYFPFISKIPFDINNIEWRDFFENKLFESQKEYYFKNFKSFFNIPNLNSLKYILDRIANIHYEENELNNYVSVLYDFLYTNTQEITFDDIQNLFLNCKLDILAKSSDINKVVELLSRTQKKYSQLDGNQKRQLSQIELVFIKYGTTRFKPIALYDYLSSDANNYFPFVQYMFSKESNKAKQGQIYFYLLFNLKICPGVIGGSFSEEIFQKWVDSLHSSILSFDEYKKDKEELYYFILGKLIGNYRYTTGTIEMPESVMTFMECINEEKNWKVFSDEFIVSVFNNNGIRTISNGKDLFDLSQLYLNEALKHKKKFKRFYSLYSSISKAYEKDASTERRMAENE